jgi:hypothetical protein
MEAAFWKRAARANHRCCLSDLCDLDVALLRLLSTTYSSYAFSTTTDCPFHRGNSSRRTGGIGLFYTIEGFERVRRLEHPLWALRVLGVFVW